MKAISILISLVFVSLAAYAISGSGYDVSRMADIEKSKVNFNGMKAGATVAAGVTQDIDLTIADDHFLTGAMVVLEGACSDDEIIFQVVHPNGTTVIATYIQWWAANINQELLYPSKVPATFKLRAKYKNTCATTVKVKINYFLHKILI